MQRLGETGTLCLFLEAKREDLYLQSASALLWLQNTPGQVVRMAGGTQI